ncbi:hypothetical protein BDY24DRAFT_397284 [Mrakia frigida]|uniref:uncharacterized protein n=1 Tax=Mrakia frigida TaxID=29902 RepID=UPI003FCC1E7D
MASSSSSSSNWANFFSTPFSEAVLKHLPGRGVTSQSARARAKRQDGIPETNTLAGEQQPLLSDYHSINPTQPSLVRVPKKVATSINVEAKVWFANERTWLAYLSISILLGSLSATLYSAGKEGDQITKALAGAYGGIAFAVLIYGYLVFQKRITLISKRSGEHFDEIVFPVLISVAIFIAILTNFILRIIEFRKHGDFDDDV